VTAERGTCETCTYWHCIRSIRAADADHLPYGYCRRRAPIMVPSHGGGCDRHWPHTMPGEWCGEWQGQP